MEYRRHTVRGSTGYSTPQLRASQGSARYKAMQKRQRHKRIRTALIVVGLITALGFMVADVKGWLGEGAGGTSGASSAAKGAVSTAQSEWTKGAVPFLYQCDQAWASSPYAGATIGEAGCGPTCMTMAYVCLTGKRDRNPASMAAFSEKLGFVEQGMTSWKFMTSGANMLGLTSRELPADQDIIVAEIKAGHPVIASVSAGDFTETGHFIVLCGVNGDGSIEVRDPNSAERSAQSWGLKRILSQTRNLWALSCD